ncbi:MAG: nicotinate-nucleotide adenylyltransferase [Planctomycetes bacterium]|nr:nicotinate-nucleotide adenylyltransferase [Planctomycetota bacterium]
MNAGSTVPERSPERVGILGGTFDPVHIGHLIVAREMVEALSLTEVLFLPAREPPHKAPSGLTPAEHRLAMLRLAIASEPLFALDERELRRGGKSYTFDTLRSLREERGPRTELFFLIGADTLPELKTWRRAPELFGLAHFATAVRPGCLLSRLEELRDALPPEAIADLEAHCIPTTPIGVSSTTIRANILQGRSIRHMVPREVETYIRARGLYRAAPSETGEEQRHGG